MSAFEADAGVRVHVLGLQFVVELVVGTLDFHVFFLLAGTSHSSVGKSVDKILFFKSRDQLSEWDF